MTSKIRIGQGSDVHQLVEGRQLIIGGVVIPFDKGLLGHSDSDVLLHAICDALLGAAALGDIGKHFSDTNPRYKNIDSRILLQEVCRLLGESHYTIVHIDATIIAQAPKMLPPIPGMISNISQDLGIQERDINIKAKTAEHLGPIGRGEGIEAEAICLISKIDMEYQNR
jgi:2-C-methyl-D-erythritol 2,4-cyclodiphosphate synthase